jgi:1,4-alpha-glucan branching enzyme
MPRRSSKKPTLQTKSVRFNFFAPEAKTVSLAGDFNEWDVNSLPMKRDRQGTWKASVRLKPGRYEYRFWADGVWQDDPSAQERASNPFGSHNCIKMVS